MRLIAFLLALAVTAGAAERKSFAHKHIPPAVASLSSIGDLEPTNQMHISIVLPLRNEAAMEELLRDQQDPASPHYRQWLTNGEFAARFGPTTNDYAAVEAWAKSKNLAISMRHENRTGLSVKGSAKDVAKAFNVEFKKYHHPTENRTFHAPDKEPTMDLPVPVLSVLGLDNLSVTKNNAHIETNATVPAGGSGPLGNYGGYDFRRAYLPGVGLTGAGQQVGIVSFAGFYFSDITIYNTYYGLPVANYTIVNINGGPTNVYIEAEIDIDMIHAMAPSASIRIYQGPYFAGGTSADWYDVLSFIAQENNCKQISCSYSMDASYIDATVVSTLNLFKTMALQGQSFFTDSADGNAYTAIPTHMESYPSVFTNVTCVGGTRLYTSGQNWLSESAWNDGTYGSGGGIGMGYTTIPSYQAGVGNTSNKGSSTKKNYPDVAMVARDIDIVYGGASPSHVGVVGTSCSTPLWAGFCALLDQYAVIKGKPVVGWLNPSLYKIGKSTIFTNCFHDITVGNNFWSSSPSFFPAVAGYDLCTGWGTPNGTNLINALFSGPVIVSLSFSNGLFIKAQ